MSHLYLLFGEEDFLKDEYTRRIQKAVYDNEFPEFNYITFTENIDTAEINNAFETYPMMSESKYIFIKDSNIFASSKKSEDGNSSKDFWKNRLSDIPDYVYVVFSEKNVDKRSALYKQVNKDYTAVEFSRMQNGDLTTWIERRFLKAERKIAKEDALYIALLCSGNMMVIDKECDKLIHYTKDVVHRDDIDKVVSKSLELHIFDITDGIMEGNSEKVMEVLNDLNTQKVSAFQTLYLLLGTFDKMLQCKLMLADYYPVKQIAEQLKIPEFITKKYISGAENFSAEFLEDMIIRIAEIDLSIKQGKINERVAFENYVLDGINQRLLSKRK